MALVSYFNLNLMSVPCDKHVNSALTDVVLKLDVTVLKLSRYNEFEIASVYTGPLVVEIS
jgi:hypothetical protein